MQDNQPITPTLIIAAGASTRLGSPKQLVKIGDKYLLEKTIETALDFSPKNTIAILGAYFEKIKKTIKHLPIEIIKNKNWEKGMGSTISYGINYLENNFTEINGTYILLSDQPFISTDLLKKIRREKELNKGKIIASKYENTFGPPAYFPKNIFPELKELNGQKGAKAIFKKYENKMKFIEFPQGSFDVDTAEDVKKLHQFYP